MATNTIPKTPATAKPARRAKSPKRPTAPAATSVRERRRSARIPSVTAGLVGGHHVQIFDVSLDGVGFRTNETFAPGDQHDVLIGNGPMYLEGRIRIVSVRPRRDGTSDVGAVFV